MLHGIDIYGGNAYSPAGQEFVLIKATEGHTFTDSSFASRWADLGHRKILRGAYHFGHPSNDPIADADHFLSVVRHVLAPGDWVVLDHEIDGGTSPAHCAAWAKTWCQHVEAATSRKPVVYTFLSFAQAGRCAGLAGYPLWMADPSSPAGRPRVPAPWSSWSVHQYGSPGGIDRDVFNGDRALWAKLGGSTSTTPPGKPPVPPVPPVKPPVVPPFSGRLLTQPPVMHGSDVLAWQRQMAKRAWKISANGAYDAAAEAVCRKFQAEKGLAVDGIVGKDTWSASWTAPVT